MGLDDTLLVLPGPRAKSCKRAECSCWSKLGWPALRTTDVCSGAGLLSGGGACRASNAASEYVQRSGCFTSFQSLSLLRLRRT